MAAQIKELSHNKLRYFCDPSQFKFKTTKELKPLSDIVGQDRAVAAIDMGVHIKNFGYNIFVVGPVGAGRSSTIKEAVINRAKQMETPCDWCYVYNFKNPDKPCAIKLAPGKGRVLERSMDRFVAQLSHDIPGVLMSEDFQKQKQDIVEKSQKKQSQRLLNLENRVREKGFTLRKVATGLVLVPLREGKPLTAEQIEALPPEEKEKMEQEGQALQNDINEELKIAQKLEQQTREKLEKHQRNIIWIVIEGPISRIREEFQENHSILKYLKNVEEDILVNAENLFPLEQGKEKQGVIELGEVTAAPDFKRFRINLIVDNSDSGGTPVIIENNPTYNNLIGRIDRISQMGTLITDFTMVRPGSLHKANGGFLIIEAAQLMQSPMAWHGLKRSIKNREVTITDLSEEYSHVSVKTLEPESIPLEVKIILIGNPQIYYGLLSYDEEFAKLFKIKAEFGTEMDLTKKNMLNYARYISKHCEQEKLLHLNSDAVSSMIEFGVGLSGNQKKLSTRFTRIRDLLVEANYWAEKNGSSVITRSDISKALKSKKNRLNHYESLVQEMISDGTIFINLTGEKIGEVNGLAVLNLGDYEMGKPSRITARTFLGQDGVIAIDREAKMTGPLHDKGVLILSGYLNGRFGTDRKISMSASITFEQSYNAIDGDSASSTELYALLSSLSGYPIKQGLAVTGSVNQFGEIQPIGGAKYKIEGFFDICNLKGLTGQQGVLIPKTNVKNLVLDDRVIDAVKDGKFHIYPVSTIEEGIEILTGVKAGKRLKSGKFTPDSVFMAVDEKLQEMSELLKEEDNKKQNSDEK